VREKLDAADTTKRFFSRPDILKIEVTELLQRGSKENRRAEIGSHVPKLKSDAARTPPSEMPGGRAYEAQEDDALSHENPTPKKDQHGLDAKWCGGNKLGRKKKRKMGSKPCHVAHPTPLCGNTHTPSASPPTHPDPIPSPTLAGITGATVLSCLEQRPGMGGKDDRSVWGSGLRSNELEEV
jgi:hypothetical protein